MAPSPSSRRASAHAVSLWPTWTPSASTSRAISTSSSITKGTPAAWQMGMSSRASATISSCVACFSRSWMKVAPPAIASATSSGRVRPLSQARSVTAYRRICVRMSWALQRPRRGAMYESPLDCDVLRVGGLPEGPCGEGALALPFGDGRAGGCVSALPRLQGRGSPRAPPRALRQRAVRRSCCR